MEITYTDAARRSPDFDRLRQIAERFPGVVGNRFGGQAHAEWDATSTPGQTRYRLTLSDDLGADTQHALVEKLSAELVTE